MIIFMLGCAYIYLESQLPDVDTLKNVQLQVPLRIYTEHGQLIAEYGEKRRTPITLEHVPQTLIDAVLATEDQRFFEHPGVDIFGLGRAFIQLAKTGNKRQGGSTITMQVAHNFFLTRKKTYIRKLNEILLAIRIDHELSKEKILELYLNKIYFGSRAYGVASAAQVYYGKSLNNLTLPQLAMIAGLPKAPSALNPISNPPAARDRRNHVLDRMYEEGYIEELEYESAISAPIEAKYHGQKMAVQAPYVAEMVRQEIVNRYGKDAYTNGYQVYTTIRKESQEAGNIALQKALLAYDQRHGYRGPIKNLGLEKDADINEWLNQLKAISITNGLQPAIILDFNDHFATALLKDGHSVEIPWEGMQWARKQLRDNLLGPNPQSPADIFKLGDVVYVDHMINDHWQLAQIPKIEGALVALDPNNGAIRTLVGGFNYQQSKFNRVIQAKRQASSAFKPFIYSAALEKGFTLASTINDAPVVLNDPSLETLWRPHNHTQEFNGPTRLRTAITRSTNLVSIRLLEAIGTHYAVDYLTRFGFDPNSLPNSLSLALGSATITPLQMAQGYAVFANGGYRVDSFIIERITDSNGNTLFLNEAKHACDDCEQAAPRVLTKRNAYLITSTLKDVIQHGTGRAAKSLHRSDLAGKTGTTNDKIDAWFSGFNSNLVASVWMGFDKPQPMHEYAAKAVLPMWIKYMGLALKDVPEQTLPQPAGLVSVRIDPETGLRAANNQSNSIFEMFRTEFAPKEMAPNKSEVVKTHSRSHQDVDHLF